MTRIQAEAMLDRLDAVDDKLTTYGDQQRKNRRLAKRANINSTIAVIGVGVAVIAVVAAVVVGVRAGHTAAQAKRAASDAKHAAEVAQAAIDAVVEVQRNNCLSGNVTRAGQRNIWQEQYKVEKASADAQGFAPGGAVQTWYEDFLSWETGTKPVFSKDGSVKEFVPSKKYVGVLADRDCTDLNSVVEDPGPAPDFQAAIDEAIKEQG